MIDKHAPQIVTADGESSSETILPCSVNASTDRADDQGPLEETVASVGKMAAVRFPLPSSHSNDPETAENRRPDRESNRASGQSPATRSKPLQTPENKQKSASQQAESRAWVTEVGHNSAPETCSTNSDRSGNRPPQWVTGVGHKWSTRGLSRRGSVYQFRVRMPADLRTVFGSTHVKRSLRTDSRSLAIRLSRKIAAEVDAMFEAKRLEIGLEVEGRLLLDLCALHSAAV